MSKSIYSYNRFSEGAKALAETMGIPRIKHEGSRYRGNARKTVINWGSSTLPDLGGSRVLNNPDYVALACDKLKFFSDICSNGELDDPRIPEWTTDRAVAQEWLDSGVAVCSRTVLRGHSANGLTVHPADDSVPLINAPLYVKYVKKKDEFRVHIVNGEVIDTQKKMKRRDFEGVHNTQIRNLANGYIFAREGFDVPEDVLEQSRRAMACSGLDFGAVDVIWNERQQQAYVLEINTAPGLMGTTLTRYAEALGTL